MKTQQPEKWHVYRVSHYLQVLSDTDLTRMDDQQRAGYQPLKLDFATKHEAMAHMMALAGQGRMVNRNRRT